jgi:hypothetical protein
MPLIGNQDPDMEAIAIPGTTFGFTATPMAALGAEKYVLADIVLDVSGSVDEFKPDMELMLATIIETLNKDPNRDSMLVRIVQFDDFVSEVHGYKLWDQIRPSDYKGCLKKEGGGTNLYGAWLDALMAKEEMAARLIKEGYKVGAWTLVATDGMHNVGSDTPSMVANQRKTMHQAEYAANDIAILVGINTTMPYQRSTIGDALEAISVQLHLTGYIDMKKLDKKSLGQLANYASSSLSSSSQSLVAGQPSQMLNPSNIFGTGGP